MGVPAEIEELIAGEALSAHLATTVEDRPHVAPVWYGYDEGVLSVLTGGKKLENVRKNRQVAVSVEKLEDGSPLWTVSLLGTAAVIEDVARIEAARERVFSKYGRGETDGGTDENGNDESEGDENGTEPASALVEITVGSATAQRY